MIWRRFKDGGQLWGYHLPNFKDEAECIKKLVDDIFPKSLQIISPFPKTLVGTQIEKVISLLDMESNDDVRSIGIWGMGGIGKTEIANVLHQRYRYRFEADCFLENVGELHQKNGLTWLQQEVICKLLGEKMTLTSKHDGMNILKSKLGTKKVLFIVDDVNHEAQLEFLVGGPVWFGMGSRIILTARDKHLLISHVGDNNVYEVQLLSEDEALELFSRHAFREKSPKEDFMELSRQVVEHAGRLPLALKVLGRSSFCGRDKKHWRHMLDRLKRIPHKDILGKLRLSFDGLDKDEKELFLDIVFLDVVLPEIGGLAKSCFYHLCEELRDVRHDYLVEKALLTNKGNRIEMHNMIREMGKNVIREEYANSRVWFPKDLFEGKLSLQITEKVECLYIPKDKYSEDAAVKYSNIFKRMQSLQILIVRDGTFRPNCAITFLPSSLRLIEWLSLCEPSQLVVLSLCESRLVELWRISKKLSNLKHLVLSYNFGLTKTPNFGDMPNLERLDLAGCVNLEEVHPSLGHCRMLTHLNLSCCVRLKKLPKFVCMKSLGTLNLLYCASLQEFPEIRGDMHRLSELRVESPWIKSLPPSLSSLRQLELVDCEVLESIPEAFRNLRDLRISGSNKLATLPNSLFESQQLEYLVIEKCENLKKLPSSIQMESLKELQISKCPKLDTFPVFKGDMHCLKKLTLNYTGIRKLPSSIEHLSGLEYLYLLGCEDLGSLPDSLCNLMNLEYLYLSGCNKLERLPENIGNLQMLEILDASKTAISQPPLSITNLGKLESLSFSQDEQQFEDITSFLVHQLSALSSSQQLKLSNHNILGGLPEDLGSLDFLRELNVSGSDISCLPKSINKLSQLHHLNIQFYRNLDELPGELPPNLEMLFADYHLAMKSIIAMKSIRNLVDDCLKLRRLFISDDGAVSSEQANVFLQSFCRTCIQCDFNQRAYFLISFPEVKIPEIFDYDQFINQKEISVDLNPSWHKFMGFWISYDSATLGTELEAILVCKSDPERIYSLKHNHDHRYLKSEDPSICCADIPFATLLDGE